MPEINPVFRQTSRLGLIALSGFFIFLLTFSIIDIYQLLSKNYFINKAELIKLDTFHLQGRAYRYAGGGKSGSSRFEFESTSRYKFRISAERFFSIDDLTELTDTLMYHDLKLAVYSNRTDKEKYLENSKKTIEVYQLSIGGKNYIDIDRTNELAASNLTRKVLLWLAFYLFLTIGVYRNRDTIRQDFIKYFLAGHRT